MARVRPSIGPARIDHLDRDRVISGMGERPAIVHMRDFGLSGFTTGSGCIASRTDADTDDDGRRAGMKHVASEPDTT